MYGTGLGDKEIRQRNEKSRSPSDPGVLGEGDVGSPCGVKISDGPRSRRTATQYPF